MERINKNISKRERGGREGEERREVDVKCMYIVFASFKFCQISMDCMYM